MLTFDLALEDHNLTNAIVNDMREALESDEKVNIKPREDGRIIIDIGDDMGKNTCVIYVKLR